MNRPTFNEQREKIIQAYFRDEIKPFDGSFCFCGTLNNNNPAWTRIASPAYTGDDFFKMETALYKGLILAGLQMDNIRMENTNRIGEWDICHLNPNYETALFSGMSAALEVLKQIHIEGGEIIDETPVFKKRELVTL